jgi:hypothetical protein
MTDPRSVKAAKSTLNRRNFLATAGAGVAGSSLMTMLDARQAPAQIKGTTLRILQWSHFIPAYDAWYDKFAKEWGDKNGVKVRVDHIPHLDIPARMAAEFAAGAGHDIIYNGSSILTRPPRSTAVGSQPRNRSSRWRDAGTACPSSTSSRRCSTGRTCSTPTI